GCQGWPLRQTQGFFKINSGQNAPADRVLQGEQAGPGEVRIVGLDRGLDLGELERAVPPVCNRLCLFGAEHRGAASLVAVAVRLLAEDPLLAALAMAHERGEIGLGARRK